jgi:Domain of unknown function (DUF4157)
VPDATREPSKPAPRPTSEPPRRSSSSLPRPVASAISSSLGVDVSPVRVHTDANAAAAAGMFGARALTIGSHVFLGRGERPTDVALMAHEVAHVVQQQGAPRVQLWSKSGSDPYEREAHGAAAAVVARRPFTVRERTRPRIQRFGISDLLDWFADKANNIPGFRMFTIVIGLNPINMSKVERSGANILRAAVELIPGGHLIVEALEKYGVFVKAGAWLEQQVATLGMTGRMFKDALDKFIDSLGWRDIFHPGRVWDRAKELFLAPIRRLIDFFKGLVIGILTLIKDAILKPLAKLAEGTPAWDLLLQVLGKNPITGEPVPQSADALIGGFMKLIRQEEIWNNIKKANAISRAFAWFKGVLTGVLAFVRQIPSLFLDALRSLEIADIVLLPRALLKIGRVFGGFAIRFFTWAGQQVLGLLQIIFEVLAPSVMPYLRKAAGAFTQIIRNPVGFIRNLVRAGIEGFKNFAKNFTNHLRRSLIEWITGALSGAGVYIPQAFELKEIVKFVLSVLGLTWTNVRGKLLRLIPESVVRAVETGLDFVVTLVKEGPAAAWEKIKESLSNLKEMVIEQIMSFVESRIVQAAITKLVTSLNPAGAFIQAILAIYNTIMFLVERLTQIGRVLASFIDSIASIAAGNVGSAAARVEQTMAGLLTLVISFLARLVGLGKVSDAVKNIVDKIRAPIDKALDKVVDWIIAMAKRIGRFFMQLVRRPTAPGADTPEAAAVKAQAISQLRSRTQARKPESVDQFSALVREVENELRPRGLKRLSVRIASPEAMALHVEAQASDPARADIRWDEVFRPDEVTEEEIEALKPLFATAGFETYAAVTVDGRLIGVRTNEAGHAEQEVIGSVWTPALNAADAAARVSKGRKVQLALAINRSPCHSICTPALVSAIGAAKRWIHPDVQFVLAATGAYAPSTEMSPAERRAFALDIQRALKVSLKKAMRMVPKTEWVVASGGQKIADPTTLPDISRLQGAGWDVRALQAREHPTGAQRQWLQAVRNVKQKIAAAVNAKTGG